MKVEELWALRDPVEFTGLFLTDFERTPIQFKVMDEIEAAFEAALAMEGRPA
jgi:hypothetical protein